MDSKTADQKFEEQPMVCPTGLEVFPPGHKYCSKHNIALTEQTKDSMIGQVVNDRYLIKESLSSGGWASIYRAVDKQEGGEVAMKVLHSHLLADAEALARFKREGKATAGLRHPYLARVLDCGVLADGQPYLTMEYVRGITLAERIAALGPLTAEQAVAVFEKVCDVLYCAHKSGIIHRDIKPSNLMLVQEGRNLLAVKLVDFGLARAVENSGNDIDKITRTGQTLGSPAYMSPEQCLGYKLDARSDIYSLGCTMYEAVSGAPPFVAQSILEYMHKHTYEQPPELQIRSDEVNFGFNLAHVIMQTLSKNPDDRQQSMQQLRDQLRACVWQGRSSADIELKIVDKPTDKSADKQEKHAPGVVPRVRGWLAMLTPIMLSLILLYAFVLVVRQGQQHTSEETAKPKPAPTHKASTHRKSTP